MAFYTSAGVLKTMASDIPTRDGGFVVGPIDLNYNNVQGFLGIDTVNDRPAGLVCGKQTIGSATSAVKASGANTGNGVLAMDGAAPIQANARTGVYTARVIQVPGANQAQFELKDPLGRSLGIQNYNGAGAVLTFNDLIKFTITDGSTDFVVGDGFDITVAAGSGLFVPYDPAGTDGRQTFGGILYHRRPANAAALRSAFCVRDLTVNLNLLSYGVSLSGPQLAVLYAQMADQKVIALA